MQSNFKKSAKPAVDPQAVAVSVLTWLAQEPEMLSRFLALTGVDPSGLRAAIHEPAFLEAMLAFVMNHEPSLMAFSVASGTSPEDVEKAYHHFATPGLSSGEY